MAEKRCKYGIIKTKIMATDIIVPDIGDFENVEIIEVLVKSGDTINKNDPVVTLESDKSSVEVPSPYSGKIASLKVKIGDKVSQGSVLAQIETAEKKLSKDPVEKKEVKVVDEKEDKGFKVAKKKEIPQETEKIIEEAESTIVKKIKEKKEDVTEKIYLKSNGADIDPAETQ